jgi:uncharacterized protein with HEPN domain
MPRAYRLYLEDMLQAAEDIQQFTHALSSEQLKTDRMRSAAVLHNLMIIGEAVKGLPDEVRVEIFGEDWKRIAGLRDFIVHTYFGLNFDILWDIITVNVPELIADVGKYLDETPNDSAPHSSTT